MCSGPRAQDEADHDPHHKGCPDPKADDLAKRGEFRNGSITPSHEQRIRSSFLALPRGPGFLESHLPAVQGGVQR